MEAGLPMEFFGADIIEGLSLGAKNMSLITFSGTRWQ